MPSFAGRPVHLVGKPVRVGDVVRNFTVINTDLKPVQFDDYRSYKYRVINVVPSLDTGVCDFQTRKINQELARRKDLVVLTISNDLPFAQLRWCGNSGLEQIITLSDYKDLDFANAFGTLMSEYRLQTRAVFVIDQQNKVLYAEYVDEVTNHPNYDALLEFVNSLT
ncbi:MAG TPA: thiol peroxidase [Haloplasmataceae bacterium]